MTQPIDIDTTWKTDAACKGHPIEWWFPDRGEVPTRALAICAECPVAVDCREYADKTGEKFGVWGGSTGRLRRIERGQALNHKRLSSADKVVEELRVVHGWASPREITERSGLTSDVVSATLTRLRRAGRVERCAESYRWRLAQ